MNMHAIVRGAIGSVNAHEMVTLYRCTGVTVSKGIATPSYSKQDMLAQVQAPSASDLAQNERLASATHRKKFYLDAPAGTINRFEQSAGDIIERPDGSYWLIVGTGDDFSREGWLYCLAVLQVEPPQYEEVKPNDDAPHDQ